MTTLAHRKEEAQYRNLFQFVDQRRRSRMEQKKQNLKAKIRYLATRNHGMVGVQDLLLHDLCDTEEAQDCFLELQAEEQCRFYANFAGRELYLFPDHASWKDTPYELLLLG